ncbi:MAG: hypothetical protein EOM62_15245 [Bacteroidia bacterium]|nr:hypothetical protein [Bacteroidia bacterium]
MTRPRYITLSLLLVAIWCIWITIGAEDNYITPLAPKWTMILGPFVDFICVPRQTGHPMSILDIAFTVLTGLVGIFFLTLPFLRDTRWSRFGFTTTLFLWTMWGELSLYTGV